MNIQSPARVACSRLVNIIRHRACFTMPIDEETEHGQARLKIIRSVTPDYAPLRPVYAEFLRVQLLGSLPCKLSYLPLISTLHRW
jgi:hypothetical protein